MDHRLERDLRRVGRWFWLTLLCGEFLSIPIWKACFLTVLGWALHRLGAGGGEHDRPDTRVPVAAVLVSIVATMTPLLVPAWRQDIGAGLVFEGIGLAAALVGVDAYLRALRAFVRPHSERFADRISADRRVVALMVLVVGAITAIGFLVADDVEWEVVGLSGGVDVNADTPFLLVGPMVLLGMVAGFYGLYRLAMAHWRVQYLADHQTGRPPSVPGFVGPNL